MTKPVRTIMMASLIMMLSTGFRGLNSEWKAPAEADALVNPLKHTEANIKSAKKIFDNVCWTCHGLDGTGNGPASAPLVIKPANFREGVIQSQSDGAIFWKLSTGKGIMSDYSQTLTANQRWQLVLYIRELGKTFETNKVQQ